jgi:hypothetical protein
MAWWRNLFARKSDYRVEFQLFTKEATRGAEVRIRRDEKAYYIALEHIEGTVWNPFGEEIGPYGSPEEAEIAAVNSPWFLEAE